MNDKIEFLANKLALEMGHSVGGYHRARAAEWIRVILSNDNQTSQVAA